MPFPCVGEIVYNVKRIDMKVLNREEMKKIKGGNECTDVCFDIWTASATAVQSTSALSPAGSTMMEVCQKQAGACLGSCYPEGSAQRLYYTRSL